MFKTQLASMAAVLALALVPTPALADEHVKSETIVANVIDASVKNADLLADGMKDQSKLNQAVGEREVRAIQIHELLDDEHERMLADTIDASDVLSSNRLLARNALLMNPHLSHFAQENGISPERVVAIDVMTLPADAVTLYVLDVPSLSPVPSMPSPTGGR